MSIPWYIDTVVTKPNPRYGVTGDRYGVRQSHPWCDPCYTLGVLGHGIMDDKGHTETVNILGRQRQAYSSANPIPGAQFWSKEAPVSPLIDQRSLRKEHGSSNRYS